MANYKLATQDLERLVDQLLMKPDPEMPKNVFDMIMEEVNNPAANDAISKEYNDLINGFRFSLEQKAACVVKMLTVLDLKKAICAVLDAEINLLTEEAKIHEGAISKTADDLKAKFDGHGFYILDENKVIK